MPGAFVSIHFVEPLGTQLSICEAFVYTDQALPIERCPSFRNQKLGSTATYNGKCYIFHNENPMNFDDAFEMCKSRGGSLLDETNPALQGFLSWELWRRHREDPEGQYWLGAVRDPNDPNNWKWINGRDVTISFWNLPGGNENCARFDGTKGWLWSDTNCLRRINFVCQHRPKTCGKPEQPPNSTMIAENYDVGSEVLYMCDSGHVLVGPSKRKCLNSGFFNEFPPNCQYIECGIAAPIRHASYEFVNGTRHYLSMVRYTCDPGYIMVGRYELICGIDGRWDGPPPKCSPEKPEVLDPDLTIEEYPSNNLSPDYVDNDVVMDNKGSDSNPPFVTLFPSHEGEQSGNDISLKTNRGPSIDNPSYTEGKGKPSRANIPIGGIIALGVFGGFVFLAAIVTTIVILVRRNQGSSGKKYVRRHDDITTSSESSSSDGHGLNKYYKRAWDNLGDGGVPPLSRDTEKGHHHPPPRSSRGDEPPRSTGGGGGGGGGGGISINEIHWTRRLERWIRNDS
ncbi:Sushi, von Willebrand factor type A, EGF and pentraxin domain-containing protein 1 [Armadillidium vulgare]|nr:Sushi, von Willebrand factor type A, EGF and pentraxin domain-containing protein 1 [Armadillidium vulgare]